MAGNNTSPFQAEQAARVNKNRKNVDTSTKNTAAVGRKPVSAVSIRHSRVPKPWLSGVFCVCVLLLLCGMALNPEGKVLQWARDALFGLMGKGAFYLSIFGMVFLSFLHLNKSSKHVRSRTLCVAAFILLYGVLHHLIVNDATLGGGATGVIAAFWDQGVAGSSGGFICGCIGVALRYLFGKGFSILIVLLLWLLALLGAMDITLFSLLEAFQNHPSARNHDENEDGPNPSERLADFVIGTYSGIRKHHEARRAARELEDDDDYDEEDDDVSVEWQNPVTKFLNSRRQEKKPDTGNSDRVKDMMNQIGGDIAEPVAAAGPAVPQIPAPYPTPVPDVKPDPAVRKVTAGEAAASAAQVAEEIAKAQKEQKPQYQFPPIDLLKLPGRSAADGTAEMKRNSARLNETLASFKIDAHIINVTRGPSVTRYEVELDKGVRLNKLTTVSDDIALSLGVASVRIAPVPGKISVVGIEVPNQIVTNVNLREVIDSREFHRSSSKSTFAVGKDIGGSCIVGNIAKMPHMLIAGTTGSGKSVCMNSIIISLLYKASPEDVKLIMVDPKMVELGIYNDIPHLLIPVVTDPKKAAGSLQWAVTEMMRRYKLMSDAGVRDLESFNSIVESDEDGEKLPQVVIIIDELADLMLVAAKEVEDSICRIAQMGRAAGMHLIIATQRPSADVITGLMKANIPSRIAFSVASAMESRIILDTQGAEKLVGKGDMLFAPIGTGKPQRVQGCFVSDSEVEAVATFVKENYKASYDESVMDEIEKTALQTGKKSAPMAEPEANAEELDGDEMLPAAVDVILETGQASVSMLQRRLKLGYARAARIVDEMEEKGIVGPFQGSKPRSILITKEQWAAQKASAGQVQNDVPFDMGVPDEI